MIWQYKFFYSAFSITLYKGQTMKGSMILYWCIDLYFVSGWMLQERLFYFSFCISVWFIGWFHVVIHKKCEISFTFIDISILLDTYWTINGCSCSWHVSFGFLTWLYTSTERAKAKYLPIQQWGCGFSNLVIVTCMHNSCNSLNDSLFCSWRKFIDLKCFIDIWRLTKMGALRWDNVVNGHQGWRLVTCIWLHAGIIHLLANMLSLIFIGIRLEQQFGFGMFFLQTSKMSRKIRKTELLSLSFASYET